MKKLNKEQQVEWNKAITLFWEHEERFKKETQKVRRKKGVSYIKCQHLKQGTQHFEIFNIWMGDDMRAVLCPICANATVGSFVRIFGIDPNYEPAEEDKKEIKENWKDWLIGLLKKK